MLIRWFLSEIDNFGKYMGIDSFGKIVFFFVLIDNFSDTKRVDLWQAQQSRKTSLASPFLNLYQKSLVIL